MAATQAGERQGGKPLAEFPIGVVGRWEVWVVLSERVLDGLRREPFSMEVVAGMVFRWRDAERFFQDPLVEELLKEALEPFLSFHDVKPVRFTVDFGEPIGWSKTIDLDELTSRLLATSERGLQLGRNCEYFYPGGDAFPDLKALRYTSKAVDAPLTSLMTFAGRLRKSEEGVGQFELRKLFTGPDHSPEGSASLRDITLETGCVFFWNWKHPGETA